MGARRGGGPEETDFGQSRFGHPDLTNFGQSNFWPIHFWPSWFWPGQFWPKPMLANPILANLFLDLVCVMVGPKGSNPEKSGTRSAGARSNGARSHGARSHGARSHGARSHGARRVGGPKFRAFFLSRHNLSWGLFVEFWGRLKRRGLTCARLEFSNCRVKPRRPTPTKILNHHNTQHTHNTQHNTSHNTQHTTCNTQHATHNIQHTHNKLAGKTRWPKNGLAIIGLAKVGHDRSHSSHMGGGGRSPPRGIGRVSAGHSVSGWTFDRGVSAVILLLGKKSRVWNQIFRAGVWNVL